MTDNKDKKLDEMEDLFAPQDGDHDYELFEIDEVSESMDFEELDIPDDIDSVDIIAVESEEEEDDISHMFADDVMDANDAGDLTNASARVISADAGKKKKIIIGAVALLVILAGIGMGAMMFMGSSEPIAEAPAPVEAGAEAVDGAEASSNRASESKPTAEPMVAAPAPVEVMPAPVPATKPEPLPKPEPVAKPVATRTSSSGASFGITGVRFQSEGGIEDVIIETSGDQTGNYMYFSVSEHQLFLVDVLIAKKSFSGNQSTPSNSRWVSTIRYASHPDKVRIVVDLIGKVPNWKLSLDGNSLRINMK